jgi:imidazolonepropionase-like amidohydrolase
MSRTALHTGLGAIALSLFLVAPASAGSEAQALVDVTVHISPGETLDHATVILRDGRIEAVGSVDRVAVPSDARVWTKDDLHVYAGFLESWWVLEGLALDLPEGDGSAKDPGLVGPSSEHVKLHPERRVSEGLHLADDEVEAMREAGFTMAQVIPPDGVLRGASALVHLGIDRPAGAILREVVGEIVDLTPSRSGRSRYPNSVMGAVAAVRQELTDARFYHADRDRRPAREGRRLRARYNPALEALGPVLDGRMSLFFDSESMLLLSKAETFCREFEVQGVGVATGGEWRRPDLLPTSEFGLILPLDFPERPKLPTDEDWIQVSLDELRHFEQAPAVPAMLHERGRSFAVTTKGLKKPKLLLERLRKARDRGLDSVTAVASLTTEPARLLGLEGVAGTVEAGMWGMLTVFGRGELLDDESRVELLFIDGRPQPLESWFEKVAEEEEVEELEASGKDEEELEIATEDERIMVARAPMDDRGPIRSPERLLVRGATIWTSAEPGVLEGADLLVEDGRIRAIGEDLKAPKDAVVIDATGKHITAGLIDAHSHLAILGSVNEGTRSCTAEVRIADVLNSEDRAIYESLAGGLTTAHLMHGSANAIGGQCQAIKLRWGAGPEGLFLKGARPTIKFALGENPKRSNVPTDWKQRFPQSRLGVEDVIRERFVAAQNYRHERENWDRSRGPKPPVDHQLEALVEVLDDERDIHCHSYRQDEILMLMRVMESFDARVAVFQHVLEGYKVADELAAHGAMASTFADWWAYKFEVYDAIPHNTTLMTEREVVVSVNSDSSDLSRRMNTEAAKSMRYGGSSAEEALNLVTINPARQLGVETDVGSLEIGKSADFVIWSADPLSTAAVCEQTWIDGVQYFDREVEAQRQQRREQERADLLARIRKDSEEESAPETAALDGSAYRPPAEWVWSQLERSCHEGVATEQEVLR